jgi:uncharacterized protein YbbC (DUF1343 family)
LVTHPAAVDRSLRHISNILQQFGVRIAALFGPEHGIQGQAQDLESVSADAAPAGPREYSLYGERVDSLRPNEEQLSGLDALVIDLQDVGSRYYTFQATMLYCLEAAARFNLQVIVLDRPNPIGGLAVEGPTLQRGFESFVGTHSMAIRHGLTMGELALLYRAERVPGVDLLVIPCEGWRREVWHDESDLPWVMPSPNMPTLETASVYPGMGLLEGTNLSEGRGTTKPFELCGAPWIDASKLAADLNAAQLPGVIFRPVSYRPTFQKYAGITCAGVQLHVIDQNAFLPVRTGLAVLCGLRNQNVDRFAWRTEPYEFVTDRPAIDLLFGSDRERRAIEAGISWSDIAVSWESEEVEFQRRRATYLLY